MTADTNPADLDFDRLPRVVDAVLDLMPTGDGWRERFAAEPALELVPVDADGWVTVTHRGDTVMRLTLDTFDRAATVGRALVMVDGAWTEIMLTEIPDAEL